MESRQRRRSHDGAIQSDSKGQRKKKKRVSSCADSSRHNGRLRECITGEARSVCLQDTSPLLQQGLQVLTHVPKGGAWRGWGALLTGA